MSRLRPGLWPLAIYLALTVATTATFVILVRGDLAVMREYWGLLALPLGMPWTLVPLLLNQFADLPNDVLSGLVAASLPLNALLLYRVGRRLDRAWSSRPA
jgi:hypothetical protein